jgi:hypothetical protein
MEDFSQLCHVLRSEYNARSIPFSLRDYARMCLESLADLISEERPERFQSAMAHFFAAICEGNELFNSLPMASRNNLNSVTIGIPPRRLFELLNDFARVFNELSLLEMSSKTVRSSLQENGFPYRPNEFFSLLEQFERLDQSFTDTTGLSTSEDSNRETNKKPEAPFLGLVFNDDLTVSRRGDEYKDNRTCVISLSPQQFKILKFIHGAGQNGRTKSEMEAEGFSSLKQEKTKINEKLIPIDLRFAIGEHKLIHIGNELVTNLVTS